MSAIRLARAATGREQRAQVRRRLPRPRRRPARRGRLGPGHAGHPGQSRACRRPPRRHGDRALERPRGADPRRPSARRWRRSSPSRSRPTWASCPPAADFLELLRERADATGALLVFDEVITGFRVARGGAQERYGVLPDLTILGKIIGGGLPAAAYGGSARADGADRARRATSTRPGRCRGTRSPWPPRWPRSAASTPSAYERLAADHRARWPTGCASAAARGRACRPGPERARAC